MKTELQLVTFEQAKKLKELGFDWEIEDIYWADGDYEHNYCLGNWNDDVGEEEGCISAPTVALALKWFRDEKGIVCYIEYCDKKYVGEHSTFRNLWNCTDEYDTYEDAESAMLDEIITLINQ
jgi:hypothetical protein